MTETGESQPKESSAPIISEQERELAQNALADFQKGQYVTCLGCLNKLETLRPKDLKVTHNKVVVEYYKGELKKTELMKKSLNAICGQGDSQNQVDDVEKSVLRYNQAVLFFHTGQYDAALKTLSKLFNNIEPLDEVLARKVCLLLIELHIATNQKVLALKLIDYIESQFISSDNVKNDKEGLIKPVKEQAASKKPTSDAASDAFKIKLFRYKMLIYVMMNQLKQSKKEWKTLVSLGMNVNRSAVYLKANLEYLRGNFKKALKLLNVETGNNTDFKTCGESAAVLYYNNVACIHYAMGKPNLALFYLKKALEENEKALEQVQVKDADPLSCQPLYTLSGNKYYELMYSIGVCLLHTGKTSQALDCFTEAAQKLHNSPKVWLRMAECCIFTHKSCNDEDFNIPKRRKDLIQKVVGLSPHRKVILASSLSKKSTYKTEGLSYAIPQTTLEFGMLCLKNALFLLSKSNESNLPTINLGTHNIMTLSLTQSSAENNQPPKKPAIVSMESHNLKMSVLAHSSYVSLCLGDYVLALQYAKSLLSLEPLPGAYQLLGNLYAAESLIFLDKIREAMEYLKPENLMDLSTFVPTVEPGEKEKEKDEMFEKKPLKPWFPSNLATTNAILKYNLAVAFAIRGELDKASEMLKQVWVAKGKNCDVPIHVIMLALYIELQLGHADVSRSIIKQHCPVYR